MGGTCVTLVDLLQSQVQEQGQKRLYTFLDGQGLEQQSLTYRQLDQQARAIAVLLAERGWSGQRLLLLYPPGLDFVAAFMGCLYAAAVAVPAYPPRLGRSARGLSRLQSILQDCRPAALLSSADFAQRLFKAAPGSGLHDLPLVATDSADLDLAQAWKRPAIDGDTLAFLQYTSGSTSSPKGVMLSHSNLLHNEEMIRSAFGQSRRSRVVSWLPPYHDMGLIGGVLQPLYAGASCLLMPPLAFLQKPVRWLEAVSRYRATTSGGPNFAYDLCVRRVTEKEKRELDLSSWQVAFNGAEPVRAGTLERFSQAFRECGFRPQAHLPCYGLAEATVFVSGAAIAEAPAQLGLDASKLERGEVCPADSGGRKLVSCGRTGAGHEIRIVDPETSRPCLENQVGEIWIRGPSLASGYWNRPLETDRSFQARLQGDRGPGPFLRSGDLGFLHPSGLYVTGRLKDLIILRGRNLYPQDIERTVERSHPALQPGAAAAFSVEAEDEERLVVVQELQRSGRRADQDEVRQAMRQAVAEEYEVQLHDAVLVLPGRVPRTSSGKVRRQACREEYRRRNQESGVRNQEEGSPDSSLKPTAYSLQPTALPSPQSRNQEAGIRNQEEGSTEQGTEGPKSSLDPTASSLQPKAFPPASSLQPFLVQTACRILKTSDIPTDCPLTGLGLDSLAAAELQQALQEGLQAEVSLASLLEGASLEDLAEEIRSQQAESPQARESTLKPGPPRQEFPLSDGQRALWFLQRLAPHRSADNIGAALRLRGLLEVGALQRCWQKLIDRHPSLRSAFFEHDGEPGQQVHSHLNLDFPLHQAAGTALAALRPKLEAEAFRPFDLGQAPLLRLALWRLAEDDHVLLVSVHHIVADFASLAVLFGELERLYAQETGGPPTELQPLPLLYSDYVEWQQNLLDGPQGERLWDYWRQKLSGPLPQLELPTDRPRPPLLPERGGSRSLHLEARLLEQLEELARHHQATLFMTLLAGFQVLLHRYSGQTDLLVGTPTSGRSDPRLSSLVGYFAGPAVLRTSLSGDPAFGELLHRVRGTVAAALQHDYPFIRLAERLQPVRDPGRAPLFQVLFSFQQAARAGQQSLAAFALGEEGARQSLGPLQMESLAWSERPVQFDLTLMMSRWQDGLTASLHYNAALFDGATAQRMLNQLASVLQAVTRRPGRTLSRIPLLGARQRFQALQEWNDTAQPGTGQCVHHLFEASCKERPDAVAATLASRGREVAALSFSHLEERTARLARHLLRCGAGAEVPVGVHLERSLEMLVGVVAILRANGAYLPLDPAFPEARLQLMLEDSRTPLLLTADPSKWASASSELCPETGASLCRLNGETPPQGEIPCGPDNLAYLIYTSGSTGRPKGVQVPHRGVVNFLRSMARSPGLNEGDALLSVTTLSFDISALELFLPLMTGARLVLADRNSVADGAMLQDTLAACRITAMQATPATWRLLLTSGWEGQPIRAFCGGEALPGDLASQILKRATGLWNLYGPTETTIWSALERVEADQDPGPVSIGRPIANTSILLLSPARAPVPPGVPGELCIGGQGVVRGYFKRPGLTADRFVPDPFSTVPGTRLYRTGDLARHRPDGRLEFLGRLDHQ
ncbi:MAG: amino acid adenylation domain-containing protein, partial [Acidobacteriota bacterium]